MRKLGGKKAAAAVLAAAMVLGSAFTAFAAGWRQDATGWWYEYDNGTWAASKWEQVDGVWYHFDGNGYMSTGWILDGSAWYFADANGAMQTGWVNVGGKFYYLNPVSDGTKGAMKTGTIQIGNDTFNFDASGACMNASSTVFKNIPEFYSDGKKYTAPKAASYSGGGSSGSSSSSISSTVKEANKVLVENVNNAVAEAEKKGIVSNTAGSTAPIKTVAVSTATNTAEKTVAVTLNAEKKSETQIKDVSEVFVEPIQDAIDDLKPTEVSYNGKTFNMEDAKTVLDGFANSSKTLDTLKDKYEVVLTLPNGEKVTYTTKLN